MLRNSIEFADEEFLSLCIAGATGSEGRSLVALNLAWAWAEQGSRVLLVDTHRRRPIVHHALGIPNDGGLIDALSSRRAIDKYVQQTSMPNLLAMTAGVGGVRSGALTAELMDEIHEWARHHVDRVIFDTPPLTRSSDAGVVARFCDAVVLVVRRDAQPVSMHERAVNLLSASNCNLLGAILNDAADDQFDLSQPQSRRAMPFRLVRDQTEQERAVRNCRNAA
jgi:capsular exopolysaccharide synthesis family protein